MKYVILFLGHLFFIANVMASGSTGYVFEGKTYYIFKNGKPVNEVPNNRAPASVVDSDRSESSAPPLYFTEDEFVRCYSWSDKNKKSLKTNSKNSKIHCIKKSELKE